MGSITVNGIKIFSDLQKKRSCDFLKKEIVLFHSRELNTFVDSELYLNQDKFRGWIEGILSKVAQKSSNKSDKIVFSGYIPVRIKF